MTVNRTSTDLVRFFGAQLTAELSGGKLANVFRAGRGTETARPLGVARVTGSDLVPASVNQGQYEVALAYLQQSNASPNTVAAMALAFMDVANRLGVSVVQLLSVTDDQSIELLERRAYQFLNQLRDNTSALGKAVGVDNRFSLINRELASFEPGPPRLNFSWEDPNCYQQVEDPPTLEGIRGGRVAFSPDEKWFAIRNPDPNFPVLIYNTENWTQSAIVGQDMGTAQITALNFHPTDPLLVVGAFSPDSGKGLRVVSSRTWTRAPGSPSFAYVNWADWSPDGEYLAVIYSNTTVFDENSVTRLVVLRRNDWSVVFTTNNNTPLRPLSGAWSPDSSQLAVYGNTGLISRMVVYRVEDWLLLRNTSVPGGNVAYGSQGPTLTFLPDNRTVVVPPNSEFRPADLFRYDVPMGSGSLLGLGATQPLTLGLAYSATVSPTGEYVFVVGTSVDEDDLPSSTPETRATLSVVSTSTWEEVYFLDFQNVSIILDVAFSPSGRWLALGNASPGSPRRPLIYTYTC